MTQVFFVDASAKHGKPLPKKVTRLLATVGLADAVSPRDRVAVKVHWGELGNPNYLRPIYVRAAVDAIREANGRPFVTDTNVLYRAARHDAIGNLTAAARNGYTAESVGAPLIVADGLTGHDAVEVAVPQGRRTQTARIASAVAHADAMVVLSHFKGHLLFGFGGALKNLGMGCATPAGKAFLHQDLKPQVIREKCIGCQKCGTVCPEDAISYHLDPGNAPGTKPMAAIDDGRCVGCGECVAVCPEEAIPVKWETAQPPLVQKTAEYAWAAVANKPAKVIYLNFLLDIVPDCDCCDWTDPPVVPNLGILASRDPVAIDQAALDLVNQAPVNQVPVLDGKPAEDDLFKRLHGRDGTGLLAHAEDIGLGSRRYDLVRL